MSQTLLVTGASGNLGRRVVELLLAQEAGPIIATSRSPEKLADLADRGVDVRAADFDQPESLAAAFAGADRLLLISTDTVDGTERRIRQHRNAIRAAEEAGVQHVVYTSLVRPGPDSPILLAPDHHATEQALADSSLDWTVLRNNVYMDMLLQSLPQALSTGQLVAAAGEGATSYVTREDCARAAAAALSSASSGHTTLDITGPSAVTQTEIAGLLSEISGRGVTYVPVSAKAQKSGMVAAGLPDPVADLLVSFDTAIAEGFLDAVSPAVEDLTGTPPQSVCEFLEAHRADLLA